MAWLQALFECCGYRAASISIDDFYLTHADQASGTLDCRQGQTTVSHHLAAPISALDKLVGCCTSCSEGPARLY